MFAASDLKASRWHVS